MDPINKALEEVENQIPPQVLRYAFVNSDATYRRVIVNIQTLIRDLVIGHRVMKDCNVKGGVRDSVNISQLPYRSTQRGQRIYHIPKSLVQGRTLINPLSVGNTSYILAQADQSYSTGASIGGLGNRILDANSAIPAFHTTDVRCVGENIILVEDIWDTLGPDIWLWGVFSNDEMMSHLNPRAWSVFEDLVVLATKAWIYNQCRIKVSEGVIEMGMDVGAFREVIESYSDANEMYREMIDLKWPKVSLLSDKGAKKRHIRKITPTF